MLTLSKLGLQPKWPWYFLCLLLGCFISWNAQSAAVYVPMGSRFTTNVNGNIVFVGNGLTTCATGTNSTALSGSVPCATTQQAVNSTVQNGDYVTMANIDIDPSAPGSNSSSANLSLPAGSTVLWAGLYWGGNGAAIANFDKASIKVPGQAVYQSITATRVYRNGFTGAGGIYQSFLDVTSMLQAAGNGTYTVADVKLKIGSTVDDEQTFGGWYMVIAYRNVNEPFRNLSVYDGFLSSAPNTDANGTSVAASVSVNLSGFLTPSSGNVKAQIGVVTIEGDPDKTGDRVQLTSPSKGGVYTDLSNTLNSATNVGNGTITSLGSHVSARNPFYKQNLGLDLDTFDTTNAIGNNETSATFRFTANAGADFNLQSVVTTAIELYAPNLGGTLTKTATDINGDLLRPGDEISYLISYSNSGQDGAALSVLSDPIPAGTTYVAGSLEIVSGTGTGVKTDATGDDIAYYDSANKKVVFNLGTGATSAVGGTVAPAASGSVKFRVRVDDTTAQDSIISNRATINYASQTLNTLTFSDFADSNTLIVQRPIPKLSKNVLAVRDPVNGTTNPKLIPGADAQYGLLVENTGLAHMDSGSLVIVDPIPANSTLFTGAISSGAPFSFVDGAVSSGLTCNFVSLSSTSDCVDFSNDGGATWAYVPNGGLDPAVTHIRFKPTGSFLGDATAGAPYPSAQIKFQVQVN